MGVGKLQGQGRTRACPIRAMSAAALDSRADLFYKPVGHFRARAQVAQLVEQRTENPRVGGSIPPLGTILFNDLSRTIA